MSLVGERETAHRGCSQQYAVVLGFPEAVQWTKLSPGAWQRWGILHAGEVGQVALETSSSVFQARQKLPGTYWDIWANQGP